MKKCIKRLALTCGTLLILIFTIESNCIAEPFDFGDINTNNRSASIGISILVGAVTGTIIGSFYNDPVVVWGPPFGSTIGFISGALGGCILGFIFGEIVFSRNATYSMPPRLSSDVVVSMNVYNNRF